RTDMTGEFWQEMKDARGKLALTALWLVVAVMVCGAFVLNSGSPVAATLTLGLAFVMAFIVALIQLILFCNLPNRILFLVISGGWLVITYFYGLDWLFRDPVQMKAWAFVCIAMAGVAIVATWRS